jgi:hypothetical protein
MTHKIIQKIGELNISLILGISSPPNSYFHPKADGHEECECKSHS